MNRRTMKKIIGLCCATFLLSGCHIYKSYDRPESIDATGIYRDPVAANDTLAANDTTNMGNLSWKEIFRDPKLQMLIEEGLANNVDQEGSLRPADIIRNPVFQQCSLDELLAIGIGYFAQFNLIINFQSGI